MRENSEEIWERGSQAEDPFKDRRKWQPHTVTQHFNVQLSHVTQLSLTLFTCSLLPFPFLSFSFLCSLINIITPAVGRVPFCLNAFFLFCSFGFDSPTWLIPGTILSFYKASSWSVFLFQMQKCVLFSFLFRPNIWSQNL